MTDSSSVSAAVGSVGGPALSVLLPTVRAWPEVEASLAALLAQDRVEGFEILVLDGEGNGLAGELEPPVRWLRAPGRDVFELRALGLAAARGGVVAISEDHCIAPSDWCRQTIDAHRRNPAAALVGPMTNHADSARRAVDRANFLLTMGPYAAPLIELAEGRLPVPTNLSCKRWALPTAPPEPGDLEYVLLADLQQRGEIGLAFEACLAHRQSWGVLRAPLVHFHSGRAYGASTRRWAADERRRWFRSLASLPRRLYDLTRPHLDRGAGGAPPTAADRSWLRALILSNVAGQLLGALAGAGSSRRRLV